MNGQNEGTIAALLRHSRTALVKRYAHLPGGRLRAAVEDVATFRKVLQKDAPADIEEIQCKEGQSRDPVHVSVSVPLESQLRHEKAEKVNSESGHLFHTQPWQEPESRLPRKRGTRQKSLNSLVAPARIELTTNGLGRQHAASRPLKKSHDFKGPSIVCLGGGG